MPKPIRSLGEFESHVSGIPCLVAVTSYYKGSPAIYSGPWAGPEEYPEADWIILDRRGYRAEWLERKITNADRSRIDEEAVEFMSN